MNPLTIVHENLPCNEQFSEDSFFGRLHSLRDIDLKAYWKLEWALVQLTSCAGDYPRDHYWPVFQVFNYLNSFFQEHSKDDYSLIVIFESWFMRGLKERIHRVFEGYFKGQAPNILTGHEYANPLPKEPLSPVSEKQIERALALARTANDAHRNAPYEEEGLEAEIHIQCMEIIYKNSSVRMQWSEQSFLGILHCKKVLDMDAYWQLEWAILCLIDGLGFRPSPHVWTIHQIFMHVTSILYAHIDPDDDFKIREASKDRVYSLLDRINVVFEGFFKRKAPDIYTRFDEKNPLLEQESGMRENMHAPASINTNIIVNAGQKARSAEWLKLTEHKDITLRSGSLIKFTAAYPFEEQVVMMICDSPSGDLRLGLITLSGNKAGYNCFTLFPKAALNEDRSITARRIYDNWASWMWPEWSRDDAWIREERLSTAELK
ncbi:Imm45 family immunity protein [Herbaspirillum seropedicae]|uniref:Imm45 family immunity protein n=1 Tax=Herbaspirillum seropedicae TaxID=964 RepID=UPI003D985E25